MTKPGDRNNIDAVLQVSATANRELYEKIRGDSEMCEALRELMKDDIEKEKEQGIFEAMLKAIKNVVKNTGVTPEEAMATMGIAVADQGKYITRL